MNGSETVMPVERMNDVDKYFMTTDFNKYIGANLGQLESDFAIKYDKRIAVTKPPMQLTGIAYTFTRNYSVRVYFSEVTYTSYNDKTKKWDFSKLNKEKISGINVKHYGTGDAYFCKDFGEVSLQPMGSE
jgi:hypothetical protein